MDRCEPAPRSDQRQALEHSPVRRLGVVVGTHHLLEIAQRQPDVEEDVVLRRVLGGELLGATQVDDRLLVREESGGAGGRSLQVGNRPRASLAEIEVPRQEFDALVAAAVERLGRLGGALMELPASTPQEAAVGDIGDERVVELQEVLAVVDRIEQAGVDAACPGPGPTRRDCR